MQNGLCASLYAEYKTLVQPHLCSATQSDLFLTYFQDLHKNFSVFSRLRNLPRVTVGTLSFFCSVSIIMNSITKQCNLNFHQHSENITVLIFSSDTDHFILILRHPMNKLKC